MKKSTRVFTVIHLRTVILLSVVLPSVSCVEPRRDGPDGSPDAAPDLPPDDGERADLPVDADADCPPGLSLCGTECIDTSTDHGHCGECGRACAAVEVCSGGTCLLECPAGEVQCGGSCVDTNADILHCGACDAVCPSGLHAVPACEAGVCGTVCEAGWSDLDGDGACETHCVPTSTVESCNGLDDDCNGRIDETFACRSGQATPCTTSCGTTGTGRCSASCTLPGPSSCSPPAESCNGADDDCDGLCDDGLGCCRGETESCTTSCGSAGVRTCSAACAWPACPPPAETCNGTDDDCDGSPDDAGGCRVPVYRFWCDAPNTDHMYKLDAAVPSGCTSESIGWYNYALQVSGMSFRTLPLYSLFTSSGNYIDHLYTISEDEKNDAVAHGATLEGVIGNCSPEAVTGMTVPLYRLWKGSISDHFYTASESEKDTAISAPVDPYILEGIACHVWTSP